MAILDNIVFPCVLHQFIPQLHVQLGTTSIQLNAVEAKLMHCSHISRVKLLGRMALATDAIIAVPM
jgi:hypothetical protein